MRSWFLCGLLALELPTGTVRMTDGGIIRWGADTFRGRDATFGAVASAEPLSEGASGEVPALAMTLAPAPGAAPADLVQPGFQKAPVRFWIGNWDWSTGAIVGTPDLMFDGQLDEIELALEPDARELALSIVSRAERLFTLNRGNGLSAMFHKSIWAGETGHDQATGLTTGRAWGTDAAPASSVRGGGSGSASFGGSLFRNSVAV
jgi:hypothetical protein